MNTILIQLDLYCVLHQIQYSISTNNINISYGISLLKQESLKPALKIHRTSSRSLLLNKS